MPDLYNAQYVLNGFYRFIVSVGGVRAEVIRPYRGLYRFIVSVLTMRAEMIRPYKGFEKLH